MSCWEWDKYLSLALANFFYLRRYDERHGIVRVVVAIVYVVVKFFKILYYIKYIGQNSDLNFLTCYHCVVVVVVVAVVVNVDWAVNFFENYIN